MTFDGHVHAERIRSIVFSPNSRVFATSSLDKTVKIWDPQTHKLLLILIHDDSLIDASFSPDGKHVLTLSTKSVLFWDAKTGKLLRRFPRGDFNGKLRLSPDGRFLLGSSYSNVILYDQRTKKRQTMIRHKHFSVMSDWKLMITSNNEVNDRRAILWNLTAGKAVREFQSAKTGIYRPARISPDGRSIVSSTRIDGKIGVRVTSLATGKALTELSLGTTTEFGEIELSSDGRYAALTATRSYGRVWLVSLEEGKVILSKSTGLYGRAAFAPNVKFLVTGKKDGQLQIFSLVAP